MDLQGGLREGESALLEGGCVEGDEAEEPGGWLRNGMAVEKTSTTDDNDRLKPGFYGRLRSPLSAHPSLGTGVDLMPPFKHLERRCKRIPQSRHSPTASFLARNPNSPSSHANISEPVTHCHVVMKSRSWMIIKEANTSCCVEGASYGLSCIYPLLSPVNYLHDIKLNRCDPSNLLLTPHLIRPAFRR